VRAAIALWCAEHRARNVQFWFMLQMAYLIRRGRVRDPIQRPAHTVDIPVRLPDDIVIDAHDLPGLARFWAQAPGWKVLSERENEIVLGPDENAPVGMFYLPQPGDAACADRRSAPWRG
jgi:hypothetical protein